VVPPGGPPGRLPPGIPPPGRGPDANRVLLGVVIGLAVALLILIVLLVVTGGKGKKSPSTTTSSSTTASSTTSSSTTSTSSTTTTSSTTSTTTAPTTTAAPAGGTRAPSVPETQQITAAALADPAPACQPSDIFIAKSDSTWAAVRCTDPQSQQAFLEVRHLQDGNWVRLSYGTAQVSCGAQIPTNVQADFAAVLGSCG
jgi:hypothetical protein